MYSSKYFQVRRNKIIDRQGAGTPHRVEVMTYFRCAFVLHERAFVGVICTRASLAGGGTTQCSLEFALMKESRNGR